MRSRLAALCLTSLLALACVAQPPKTVSWEELQKTVRERVCVRETPAGQRVGLGSECQPASLSQWTTPVDEVLAEIKPLLMGKLPDIVRQAIHSSEDITTTVQNALLTDPEFLGMIGPRLQKKLAGLRVECHDCPEPARAEPRQVSWNEMGPYAVDYVTVSPVRTPPGQPPQAAQFSFHICGSGSGPSSQQSTDPVLSRAAFVSLYERDPIRQRVGQLIGSIFQSIEYQAMATDADRTSFLRAALRETLLKDSEFRKEFCRSLETYSADVGVALQDCP